MHVDPQTPNTIVKVSSATPVGVMGAARVAATPRAPYPRDRVVVLPGAMHAGPCNLSGMWADVGDASGEKAFARTPSERSGPAGVNAAVSGAMARRSTTPQDEVDAIVREESVFASQSPCPAFFMITQGPFFYLRGVLQGRPWSRFEPKIDF